MKSLFSVLLTLSLWAGMQAQTVLDIERTLSEKEMARKMQQSGQFAYNDFVKGNVYQSGGESFTMGMVNDVYFNYDFAENAVYVKQDGKIHKLNTASLKGLYTIDNDRYFKLPAKFGDQFCEVMVLSEIANVYRTFQNGTFVYYAFVGNDCIPLEPTIESIEKVTGFVKPSIGEYIKINRFDLNNKDHLKLVLQQYAYGL